MKLKNIFVLVAISSLLTGCFETSSTSVVKPIDGFHIYDGGEFILQVPNEWETLTPAQFKSDMPANTVIAFKNNIKGDTFTGNVVVMKNVLPVEAPSLDYAKELGLKMEESLLDYKEMAVTNVKIRIGGQEQETLLIQASGKEKAERDSKIFAQVSGVKKRSAFVVLGAYLPGADETVTKKIETVLNSFEVK